MLRAATLAALFICGVAVPAVADEVATIDRWYAALGKADQVKISDLLTQDAVVDLRDLGIVQTKTEFVDSMEEWATSIEGGSIRHKPDGLVHIGRAYKVCYQFKYGARLTREVFNFSDGLIAKSVQTPLADNCSEY